MMQTVTAVDGKGLWFVRGHFHLGEGQSEGLKWSKLRDRMLASLKGGLDDPRLCYEDNESTKEQLDEERTMVRRLMDGEELPFVLDTTMAIATTGNAGEDGRNELALISPTPFDEGVRSKVDELGTVVAIVASNLQHWLFLPRWAQAYPQARIYLAPSALGEDLSLKLQQHTKDNVPQPTAQWTILADTGFQLGPHLEQQLLQGAPLNMNEVVFFHTPSKTLITSDSFYGGYAKEEEPTWFGRTWFKLTKKAFRSPRLPIYRTSRVVSHGSPDTLQACVADICKRWPFDRIIFAHGTSPYTEDPSGELQRAWSVLTELQKEQQGKKD